MYMGRYYRYGEVIARPEVAIVRAGQDGLVCGERVGGREYHVEQEVVPALVPVVKRIQYSPNKPRVKVTAVEKVKRWDKNTGLIWI